MHKANGAWNGGGGAKVQIGNVNVVKVMAEVELSFPPVF